MARGAFMQIGQSVVVRVSTWQIGFTARSSCRTARALLCLFVIVLMSIIVFQLMADMHNMIKNSFKISVNYVYLHNYSTE